MRRLWSLRLGVLVVGLGVAAVVIGWRGVAIPYVERALSRASGHRVTVGRLRPGLRVLEAREVVVYGAAPFASAPLARIGRLRVSVPAGRFWRPLSVEVLEAQITYLRAGAADNLRGAAQAGPARRAAEGASRPPLFLRGGRLEGFIRHGEGPALALRGDDLSAEVDGHGELRARLPKLVAELQGVLSVSVPGLEVTSGAGRRSFSSRGGRVTIPTGGTLVEGLVVAGELGQQRGWLKIESTVGPPLRASAEMADGGLHASFTTRRLPLGPLRPLLRGHGLFSDRAVADVALELEAQPGGGNSLSFDLDLAGVDVRHPRLDGETWRGLSLRARGEASFSLALQRLEVERAHLTVLGVPLELRGTLAFGALRQGSWRLSTPPGQPPACGPLPAAQAGPVRETLAGLELGGRLGFEVALVFDAAAWEELALDVRVDPRCQVLREPERVTQLLEILRGGFGRGRAGAGGPLMATLPLDERHPDFVAIDRLPAWLPAAFVTAEDGRFFTHQGFDPEMIRRALAHDLEVADFAKGASTITQQLAKNLFLGPERTLARKLEELVLAWRLHHLLSKRKILELYLNVIELGPGIRGVRRAAQAYFGKPVTELGPLEAAHLASLTPNPLGYARRFRDGRVDEGWLLKLYDLLGMMRRSGRLTAAELAAARNDRLSLNRI